MLCVLYTLHDTTEAHGAVHGVCRAAPLLTTAAVQPLGSADLGLHYDFACPRWGTPRASPPPPGAPGGDITVKPEVFLTPSRPRATVYSIRLGA